MGKDKGRRACPERRSIPAPERGPAVSAEVRKKLATCCAFFKAEQYREAGPENLRESDVDIAEQKIDAVIEKSCGDSDPRGRNGA